MNMMTIGEAMDWAARYDAARGRGTAARRPASPAKPPTSAVPTVRLTESQFAALIARIDAVRTVAETGPVDPARGEEAGQAADLAWLAAQDPAAASAVQKMHAGVPIHELTGDESQAVRRATLRAGMRGFFSRGRQS